MRPTRLLVVASLAGYLCGQEPKPATPPAPDALAVSAHGEDKLWADLTMVLRHEPADAPCIQSSKVPCTNLSHWIVELKRAGKDPSKPLRFTFDQGAEIEKEIRSAIAARQKRDRRADPPPFEVGIVAPAIVPFAIVRRLHDVIASVELFRFHVVVAASGKRRIEQCLSFEIPAQSKPGAETTPDEREETEMGDRWAILVTVRRTDADFVLGIAERRFKPGARGAVELHDLLKDARADQVRIGHENEQIRILEDATATWADVVNAVDVARTVGFQRFQLAPPLEKK